MIKMEKQEELRFRKAKLKEFKEERRKIEELIITTESRIDKLKNKR